MQVASSNGVTLAVHDLGGDGDPLLIAHATGFHGRAYEALAEALGERHHVWALDVRAHGDSTAPVDGDFSWNGAGDDVLAAVDAVGGGPVHAFGHSMGGAALLLAALARPGVLRCAYLFEPIVFPTSLVRDSGANPMSAAARRRRASFPSKADALWHYARRTPLSALQARSLGAYVDFGFEEQPDGTVTLKCTPEHEARTFEVEDALRTDRIGVIGIPVVVGVGGAEADAGPATYAGAVAEALPDARLKVYGHLGHLGPLQDPATVADDVLALTALA